MEAGTMSTEVTSHQDNASVEKEGGGGGGTVVKAGWDAQATSLEGGSEVADGWEKLK